MQPDRDIAQPTQRPDGSWRYALQVVVQNHGKWSGFGFAHFELVGYADTLAGVKRLQDCLL